MSRPDVALGSFIKVHLDEAYPHDCVGCGNPINRASFERAGCCERCERIARADGLEVGAGVVIRAAEGDDMDELNPNHPVTIAAREQWHKIAALLIHKLGDGPEVVITPSDIAEAIAGGLNIVLEEKSDGLHVRIVDDAEARRLARKEGGLRHEQLVHSER